MFIEEDVAQHNIDDWLADERGDNTVQIVIFAARLLRFLWFSIHDIGERQQKAEDDVDRMLKEGIPTALKAAIEVGHSELWRLFSASSR